MVSRRIREFGLKPVVGDLVISSEAVNSSGKIREFGLKPVVGDLVISSEAVNFSGTIGSRGRENKPYYNSLTDNWSTLELTNSEFSPTTNLTEKNS